MGSPERLEKLVSRRRVFLFSSIILLVFGSDIAPEIHDSPLFAVDDIIAVILGVIGILLYFLMRRKDEPTLSRQSNIYLGIFIVAFVMKLGWTFIEFSHADDVADDIPAIIILIAVLANRFL
ncbi:MAG: hypothetical protein QXY87_11540 [Saccharolobus sp.]|uniref:Uncharacterized protein n=2 Tax=Saccharolobus shibatae TaxID=2286 RepID=A0A8F5GTL0_SACSH|nr:hypothetical protein [Saccharolobus shibatae]MCH4816750.1 hypothetical protein [Saccharolobus shibatae]QXJ29069.1 hypothetical protein J5U23_01938 [Saccharolobus shibatae B12]QXJ35354.1 hypothetical protein J5U22_01901 [Saccharolobus shibatae]